MEGVSRDLSAFALLFALWAWPAASSAGDPLPVPERGVVLLRNENVLEGVITRVGDEYYVVRPDVEMHVKADQVEMVCRDLDEAYWRKRATIQAGRVDDHLRLAQWCLRQDLLGHAGRELADAMDADPRHPMIPLLRRRLEVALEPAPERSAAAPPVEPPGARLEELDQMARQLPAGTMETFTDVVQPILMNHCGSGSCHGGPSASKFRLARVPSGRPRTRRLTLSNLEAVLGQIDNAAPDASPLLNVPAGPHGKIDGPVFSQYERSQYERLVEWVRQVSRPGPEETPASVDAVVGPAPASQVEPSAATPASSPGVEPATFLAPAGARPLRAAQPETAQPPGPAQAGPAGSTEGGPAAAQPFSPRPRVQCGAALKTFVPADPFDPEIFNRRYFSRGSPGRR